MNDATLHALFSVKEGLTENHTSDQLLTVLDNLLYLAVDSVVRHTNWLDLTISNLITWYTDNTRRKIASNVADKSEVFDCLVTILMSRDPDFKMKVIRSMQMERSFWFRFLRIFVESCPDHTSSFHDFIFLTRSGGSLKIAKRDAAYWYNNAVKMKRLIMEKYLRYVGKQAVYAKKKNPELNLDDCVQNFSIALMQAVDKCSSDKGTLTTYISQWLFSAQSKSKNESYGIAYTIPDNKRKEYASLGLSSPSNYYVPIQDVVNDEGEVGESYTYSPTQAVDSEDYSRHILKLAKHADPVGYGRYLLGLSEILV